MSKSMRCLSDAETPCKSRIMLKNRNNKYGGGNSVVETPGELTTLVKNHYSCSHVSLHPSSDCFRHIYAAQTFNLQATINSRTQCMQATPRPLICSLLFLTALVRKPDPPKLLVSSNSKNSRQAFAAVETNIFAPDHRTIAHPRASNSQSPRPSIHTFSRCISSATFV